MPFWVPSHPIFAPLRLPRQLYIEQLNDPYFSSPEPPRWFHLFTMFELFLEFPATVLLLSRFLRGGPSEKSPSTDLLALVYALVFALTTSVCVYEVPGWDSVVYSDKEKDMFMFAIYGPFAVLRKCCLQFTCGLDVSESGLEGVSVRGLANKGMGGLAAAALAVDAYWRLYKRLDAAGQTRKTQ